MRRKAGTAKAVGLRRPASPNHDPSYSPSLWARLETAGVIPEHRHVRNLVEEDEGDVHVRTRVQPCKVIYRGGCDSDRHGLRVQVRRSWRTVREGERGTEGERGSRGREKYGAARS